MEERSGRRVKGNSLFSVRLTRTPQSERPSSEVIGLRQNIFSKYIRVNADSG